MSFLRVIFIIRIILYKSHVISGLTSWTIVKTPVPWLLIIEILLMYFNTGRKIFKGHGLFQTIFWDLFNLIDTEEISLKIDFLLYFVLLLPSRVKMKQRKWFQPSSAENPGSVGNRRVGDFLRAHTAQVCIYKSSNTTIICFRPSGEWGVFV